MKKYSAVLFFALVSVSVLFVACASSGILATVSRAELSGEYFDIAQSYEELKKYDKAIQYYGYASSSEEYKNVCSYRMAYCYAMKKDWGKAGELYSGLLTIDEENVSLQISLAYCYAMGGKLYESAALYEAIVSKNPDLVEGYKNYLSVLIAKDDKEKALEVFALLSEKFPDDESIPKFKDVVSKWETEAKSDDVNETFESKDSSDVKK